MTTTDLSCFQDREDAARQLAERLKNRDFQDPLVLAIPRGGVVTGAVLAQELHAELDVVLSRKLRAPHQPEYAIGAIGEDGRLTLSPDAWLIPGMSEEYLEAEKRHQVGEIARRKRLIRGVRPPARITGRSVVVTDDGIATGSTMIAALQAVRARSPHELIAAAPVAAPERLTEIRRWCDEVVCLLTPASFRAIGEFYARFDQVEDEEVVRLLREAEATRKPADASQP